MANTCTTTYVITGEKKTLDDIYSTVKDLEKIQEFPELKSLFRNIDPFNREVLIYIRKKFLRKEYIIEIDTVSKWNRSELTPFSFKRLWPTIEVWFISEELGCNIFETNDTEGIYCQKNVIIDVEGEDTEYCNRKKAAKRLNELLGKTKTHTLEELQEELNDRNILIDNGKLKKRHIWLYIAEAV